MLNAGGVIRHQDDPEVREVVENAAKAACDVLDDLFPGFDGGGISSNFQGHLVEVLTYMLKGCSVLDRQHGHTTSLPPLVIDANFFGSPLVRGDAFLVVKAGDEIWDHGKDGPVFRGRTILSLEPGRSCFRPISAAGDAWTSFEGAAESALRYLRAEGLSQEQARELGLKVLPVTFDPARERGFVLAEAASRLAVSA